MKILFVCNDAWFFASHRLPIAKALSEQNHTVYLIAKRDDSVPEIETANVTFMDWGLQARGQSPLTELRSIAALYKKISKVKPDIIHLITIKPVLYGGIIARIRKVPGVLYAVSGLGAMLDPTTQPTTAKTRIYRSLLSILYRFAVGHKNATLVFQNPDNRDELLAMIRSPDLTTTIIRGSGVDMNLYPYADDAPEPLKVVLAARLLKDKGVTEFTNAATIVKKQFPSVQFVVAGSNAGAGNPAAYTDKELSDLKSNPDVTFIGHCSNIPALFQSAHIIVLPSYHEGLPKALIEAAASGRAVVTTDVPGCRYAIEANVTGLLVPPRNTKRLAEAIAQLCRDGDKRRAMGLAGRQFAVQHFRIEEVVERHLMLYDELAHADALSNQPSLG